MISAAALFALQAAAGAQPAPAAVSNDAAVVVVYLTPEATARAGEDNMPRAGVHDGSFGARTAVEELNLNAAFAGRSYELRQIQVVPGREPPEALRALLRGPSPLVVADLEAADLLAVADLPHSADAVVVDARSSSDALRQGDCRRNVFHVLPDWSMRADALGQFIAKRNWRRWFLLSGTAADDAEYAAAVRRAAARVGARLVADRVFSFPADDADEGRREQAPALLQRATRTDTDYDVLVVVDTADAFGPQLPFNTARPRPIAGTHGLVPAAWHRAFREYAARAMTLRFQRLAGREMTERDYGSWLAVAVLGEAISRAGRPDAEAVGAFLRSDRLSVPAFKGEGLNFRPWDQQLRQPVPLFGPDALVSMSPQEGYAHAGHVSDALGRDRDETQCRWADHRPPAGN